MSALTALARAIKRIVEHPVARIVVGLSVAGTGLDDLLEQVTGTEGTLDLDVHHGAILFGAVHVLKALADMLEGMETVGAAVHSETEG